MTRYLFLLLLSLSLPLHAQICGPDLFSIPGDGAVQVSARRVIAPGPVDPLAGWTPASITALIFLGTPDNYIPNAGAGVASWTTDYGPIPATTGTKEFSQAVEVRKPLLIGTGALYLDGVDDYLYMPGSINTASQPVIYTVASFPEAGTGNIFTSLSGSTWAFYQWNSGVASFVWFASGANQVLCPSNSATAGSYKTYIMRAPYGAEVTLSIDDTVYTGPSVSAISTINTATFGSYANDPSFAQRCDIKVFALLQNSVTDAEIASLSLWLEREGYK